MQEKAKDIFPIRLKQARLSKSMTQEEVARKFKMSLRGYVFWEQGRNEPSINSLVAIADLFDVSLDWLLGRSDEVQFEEH